MTLVQLPPVAGVSDPLDESGSSPVASLVERARTDRDAFAELYRLYLPRIYAFTYRRCGSRAVAEDVTAATFEEALRSLPSFVPKGGGFGPWLFRIAANEIVDHYRADQRARGRQGHRALTLLALPVDAADAGDLPGGGENHGRLLAALATLNPRYQKAVSLRYLAGLSHAEAAEAMGTTKPVMAVTLHRALRALRRALDVPERTASETEEVALMFGKAQGKPASLMNEVDRRLREAGQAPVPPPDQAFAALLEDRLRAGALAPEPALRPAPRPAGRHWNWLPPMAVAAALALVLGSVAVLRGGGDREVRVASATDTVVVLPDGTVGPATPGLVIPDGSRLQTGSDGRVVAGETELGPKQEAKINKGAVKQSPTTLPHTPSEPSTPPSTVPTATTSPPVGAVTPRPTSPTTSPTPTTGPRAGATPSTTKPTMRPTDTKPTTTSTSGPATTVAALKIDARYRGETVKLQWSAYGAGLRRLPGTTGRRAGRARLPGR